MSTQTPPAKGNEPFPFKTQEEFEAFMRRVVTEEAAPALAKAMQPLTEAQMGAMQEMLARSERAPQEKRPAGHMFARWVRALAMTFIETKSNDIDAVKRTVKKAWGDDDPILKGIEDAAKLKATASQAGDAASLGNLIIPQWSREIVPLLRNRPVIRSIARVIPNPTGSLTLRRQTSAGTAYWVGEGKPITASKPGVGLMNFLRKKLAAISVFSNDLLRFAGSEADQFVLDDLLTVIALAEDLSLLRGDGTEYSPKGIRNLIAAANVFAQTGVTLAAVDADYAKAMRLVEENNVDANPDNLHWLLVPRTWWGLWNLAAATDTGFRPYREGLNMSPARILGAAAHKTNQIPKNLGGGANESETYLVHGPSLWIADTLNTQVEVFPGGAYEDGGVVISGISRDETPVRVLRELDFNMRHLEAGAVHTGVTLS